MAERAVNRDVDSVGLGAVAVLRLEEPAGDLLRGWAQSDQPDRPAALGALAGDDLVALAVADKYDAHAFAEARGFGWIGFRLDLGPVPDLEPGARVDVVCLKSGRHLHTHTMGNVRRRRRVRRTVYELMTEGSEDQVNFEVEQIGLYLEAAKDARGAEAFVAEAYRYVLRREGDPGGIVGYATRLAGGFDTTALLLEMKGSAEFSALSLRPLLLPSEQSFPFRMAR